VTAASIASAAPLTVCVDLHRFKSGVVENQKTILRAHPALDMDAMQGSLLK